MLPDYYHFRNINITCPVSSNNITPFLCCWYESAQRPVCVCVATLHKPSILVRIHWKTNTLTKHTEKEVCSKTTATKSRNKKKAILVTHFRKCQQLISFDTSAPALLLCLHSQSCGLAAVCSTQRGLSQ